MDTIRCQRHCDPFQNGQSQRSSHEPRTTPSRESEGRASARPPQGHDGPCADFPKGVVAVRLPDLADPDGGCRPSSGRRRSKHGRPQVVHPSRGLRRGRQRLFMYAAYSEGWRSRSTLRRSTMSAWRPCRSRPSSSTSRRIACSCALCCEAWASASCSRRPGRSMSTQAANQLRSAISPSPGQVASNFASKLPGRGPARARCHGGRRGRELPALLGRARPPAGSHRPGRRGAPGLGPCGRPERQPRGAGLAGRRVGAALTTPRRRIAQNGPR